MTLGTAAPRGMLLAGLLVLATATAGIGQVLVGIKGGLNVSNADAELDGVDVDTDTRTGYHFGGLLNFGLAPAVALQLEGLITTKGFKVSEVGADDEIKLTYFEIPVLLMLHAPTPLVQPRVFLGPTVGIETSCKVEETVPGEGTTEEDCDNSSSTDFGLMIGGGVRLSGLTLDIAYDLGFTNVIDDTDGEDASVKNRNFTFSVGFVLPIN